MKSARSICRLILLAALAAPTLVYAADAPPPATTRPARGFGPGAGGPRDPGQMLKMQRQRLEELNLSDDQKKKLDEIYASAEADFKKALEETRDASPQERREKVGPVLFGIREKVMGVLTEEQKRKLQEKGPGFGRPGGPGGGMNQIGRLRENLDKLDLTAEQKPKIAAALEDAQKKADALRAEMENGNADRQQLMDKGMQIRDETRAKLEEILTPEQKEKLRGMMQPPPEGPGRRGGDPGPRRPDRRSEIRESLSPEVIRVVARRSEPGVHGHDRVSRVGRGPFRGFWILDFGFWILDFGFWISAVRYDVHVGVRDGRR